MKFLFLYLLLCLFLVSCKSAKDALTLKKKSSADEFLVEKKNPLVLPPDYGKLPKPDSGMIDKDEQNAKKNDDISLEDLNKTSKNVNKNKSSIEKTILEKIK